MMLQLIPTTDTPLVHLIDHQTPPLIVRTPRNGNQDLSQFTDTSKESAEKSQVQNAWLLYLGNVTKTYLIRNSFIVALFNDIKPKGCGCHVHSLQLQQTESTNPSAPTQHDSENSCAVATLHRQSVCPAGLRLDAKTLLNRDPNAPSQSIHSGPRYEKERSKITNQKGIYYDQSLQHNVSWRKIFP